MAEVFEKLSVLYIKDTTVNPPEWKPIPAITGQSVSLSSTESVIVDGRQGYKYTFYDERSGSSPSFTVFDGKDGVDGNGTVIVDGQTATAGASGAQVVTLHAIRYDAQTLSTAAKATARNNIDAMQAIAAGSTGQVIKSNGTGWVSASINEVPATANVTSGYILTANNNTCSWQALNVSAIATATISALFT